MTICKQCGESSNDGVVFCASCSGSSASTIVGMPEAGNSGLACEGK
jgi:uncharacterized membrane protein YvbJ